MSPLKPPSGRTSGAQPGNKNAQKHGFYSDLYSPDEQQGLSQPVNISEEQALLRATAHRLARHLRFETLSRTELSAMFHLMLAVQHINNIERTIQLGRGKGGELGQTILEALKEMNPEADLG